MWRLNYKHASTSMLYFFLSLDRESEYASGIKMGVICKTKKRRSWRFFFYTSGLFLWGRELISTTQATRSCWFEILLRCFRFGGFGIFWSAILKVGQWSLLVYSKDAWTRACGHSNSGTGHKWDDNNENPTSRCVWLRTKGIVVAIYLLSSI